MGASAVAVSTNALRRSAGYSVIHNTNQRTPRCVNAMKYSEARKVMLSGKVIGVWQLHGY